MTAMRVTTIRLPLDLAEDLEATARVDGMPMSHAIKAAITAHIEARRADPTFQSRLRARIETDKRLMDDQEQQ